MNNVTINGYGSFIQEKDLHDLMRALAKNQTLTENMMLAIRGNHWKLALSLIRPEMDADHRSVIRKMVDFMSKGLQREHEDGQDFGSTVVEDLPIPGAIGVSDVVVSWADTESSLKKEVESIRACLDVLGIFNEEGHKKLQELHIDHLDVVLGEGSIKFDHKKHEFSASGNLRIGKIFSLLGYIVPGLAKAEIGGTINHRIPFKDSRDKFIAALLALQLQSNGQLYTCSELQHNRELLAEKEVTVEDLQKRWKKTQQSIAYLQETLTVIDSEMSKAYAAHPMGYSDKVSYDVCLRAVRAGQYASAIRLLDEIQHPLIPVKQAMGENYYLFAANVIMQAQIGMFQEDLQRVLKDRFGIDPQDLSSGVGASGSRSRIDDSSISDNARALFTGEASSLGSPTPPTFLSRRPGSRRS